MAARHPQLQIVAARPGWPWQAETIAVLMHKRNIWYEVHGEGEDYLLQSGGTLGGWPVVGAKPPDPSAAPPLGEAPLAEARTGPRTAALTTIRAVAIPAARDVRLRPVIWSSCRLTWAVNRGPGLPARRPEA